MKLPNIATTITAATSLLVTPRDVKTHDDNNDDGERRGGVVGTGTGGGFEPAVECGEYPALYCRPPVNFTGDLLWKYVCGDW